MERCENMYALGISYLKYKNSLELKNLLKELTMLEDNIRICSDIEKLNNYKLLINRLEIKIEGIINE